MFARGSGAEAYHSEVYYEVADGLELAYQKYGLTYRLREVEYPAVPIANLQQIFEAYISAGRAYEFGASVEAGVQDVLDYRDYIRWKCPDTKFVLIGYSQGAMVMKDAAKSFSSDELRFVLTIGDPETYLPEGEGWFPRACTSSNIDYSLSHWRYYAPECHTFEGLFGGAKPYEPEKFRNKYALMCNVNDFICGSSHNPFRNDGHTKYAGAGLVRDAVCDLVDAKFRDEQVYLEGLTTRPASSRESSDIVLATRQVSSNRAYMRRIGADRLLITWETVPGAENVLISLNGVVLGYVEATRGELEIRDMDFRIENKVSVTYLARDGEILESETFEPSTLILPLDEEVPLPAEPVLVPESEPEVAPIDESVDAVPPADDAKHDSDSPDETITSDSPPVTESIPAISPTKTSVSSFSNRDSPDNKRTGIKITIALLGASAALFLFWFGKRR